MRPEEANVNSSRGNNYFDVSDPHASGYKSYTGDAANEARLTLTDATNLIVSGTNYMGRYTTLLKWHFADPVSAEERLRNDGVYSYQTNRNPFVDHPEWVAAAFIPPLTIARHSTNVLLQWTNDYAPTMVAEQSTNLLSVWSPLTNQPTLTTSNTFAVTLTLQSGVRFYHLRLQ